MSSQAAELARRLARDAEAVCRHYLSNGRREGRYWLVGDVRNTPGRSLFVRLKGPDIRQGRRRQMDRRRHRRTWRPARPHRHEPGARSPSRRARRGASASSACHGRSRRRTARDGSHQRRPDPRNPHGVCSRCRSRFRAQSRKRICADAALRLCTEPEPPLPPALLLSARCRRADRDLAGDDRRRHRSRRQDHRRASHLARSRRARTRRRSTRRDGRWAICSGNAVRFGVAARCHGGRRRHRDHAVAAMRHADHADGRRRSRPHHLAAILFPATLRRLYIARDDDPAGDARDGDLDRPGAGGRDRGDHAVADARATSTKISAARHRCVFGQRLRVQLAPEDVARFMELAATTGTGDEGSGGAAVSHRIGSR